MTKKPITKAMRLVLERMEKGHRIIQNIETEVAVWGDGKTADRYTVKAVIALFRYGLTSNRCVTGWSSSGLRMFKILTAGRRALEE